MKYFIYIIIFLATLHSCEEEVPIDVSGVESKPVLSSLFFAGDSFKVNLSKTAVIGQDDAPEMITGATVDLFVNNNFAEQLNNIGNGEYRSELETQPGNTYELQVQAGEYSLSGKCFLPDTVSVIRIDSIQKTQITIDDYYENTSALAISFTFKDLPGSHFYAIDIEETTLSQDSYYDASQLFFYEYDYMSADISLEEEPSIILYDYLRFPDTRFDGEEKMYKLGMQYDEWSADEWINQNSEFELVFYMLSEDYYKYLQTRDLYYSTVYDFFAESVNFHTNIDGGIGIFAGASIVRVPIDIVGAIQNEQK